MPDKSKNTKYFTVARVTDSERRTNLLAALVADRIDWPRLQIAPSVDGNGGWDVVVRVDGSYATPEMAQEALEALAQRASGALGLPAEYVPGREGGHGWLRVTCPYCGSRHEHDAGTDPYRPQFGERFADCGGGPYTIRHVINEIPPEG